MIEKSKVFEELFNELKDDPEYELAGIMIEITDAIESKLDGRPHTWLAGKIGVSRSWISRFMSGGVRNPCLLTLVKIGNELGISWKIIPVRKRKSAK